MNDVYTIKEKDMVKRLADWMEKVSVAALAVGLFQGRVLGIIVAAVFFGGCLVLTKKMEGRR